MSHIHDRPHTVYLHRDEAGRVIYIGLTSNLEQRTRQHRSTSEWRRRIATVDIDSVHPNFRTGAQRERDLITQHRPAYNRSGHALGLPRRKTKPLAALTDAELRFVAELMNADCQQFGAVA